MDARLAMFIKVEVDLGFRHHRTSTASEGEESSYALYPDELIVGHTIEVEVDLQLCRPDPSMTFE